MIFLFFIIKDEIFIYIGLIYLILTKIEKVYKFIDKDKDFNKSI